MALKSLGSGQAQKGLAQDRAVGLGLEALGPYMASFAALAVGPQYFAQVGGHFVVGEVGKGLAQVGFSDVEVAQAIVCLLYTSDAADV